MGKVITVAGSKGGVGKSMLAVNIAKDFANFGYNVLLADVEREGETFERYEECDNENLTIIQGYSKSFPKMLDTYRKTFDFIVCDTAGVPMDTENTHDSLQETINTKCILKADLVIAPITADIKSLSKTQRMVEHLIDYIEEGIYSMDLIVVHNRVDLRRKKTKEIEQYLKTLAPIATTKRMIRENENFRASDDALKSVREYAPNSESAFQMKMLYRQLAEILGMEVKL